MFLFFIFVFAVFKLAGWPTRATIARGSQWVPKDSATISLSLSLSLSLSEVFMQRSFQSFVDRLGV